MELRQLRHFQEIVRASSFGQAAERLNITQPALSKSIRNLERALGLTLLERHPSGVTPTDYGHVFLEYCSLVTSELDRAVEELNALKGSGRGVVRVGAGASMMRYVMPGAVRRFLDQTEGASVTFRQGLRAELLASLRRGEVDVVLGAMGDVEADEEFRYERVLIDTLVVVADAGHPLVGRRGIGLAECAPYRWILPGGPEAEAERLLGAVRRATGAEPQLAVRTASSDFMAAMLKGSRYLSYCPSGLVGLEHDYAHLTPLDLDQTVFPPVTIGAIYRRRGVMLPSTRRFINRLKDAAGELVPA